MTAAMSQNVIAIMSDVDKTLTRSTLTPLFERLGLSEGEYFSEVNHRYVHGREHQEKRIEGEELQLPEDIRLEKKQHRYMYSPEVAYVNPLLRLNRNGELKEPVTRKLLREIGRDVVFYDGVPGAFRDMKKWVSDNEEWSKYGISLEVYLVSSGLAEILRGTSLAEHCDGIFGLEVYADNISSMTDPVTEIGSPMTFTDKTQFVHRIHKGHDVGVNDFVPPQMRRVSSDCLIYIGDGPTDVPPMATVKTLGGVSFAAFENIDVPIGDDIAFEAAWKLMDQGRVFAYAPADYREGQPMRKSLEMAVRQAAERIVARKETALRAHTKESVRFE